jgi:ADP-heptose:LPS heptosyltransferase/GT2 family glycosyltransferase
VPVEYVMLVVNGVTLGQIEFGTSNQTCGQHLFIFPFARTVKDIARDLSFTIAVRTQADTLSAAVFTAAPHPTQSGWMRIISGPTAQGDPNLISPIMVYVDRAAIDASGRLLIEGWAVSLAPIVTIRILSDDRRLSSADYGRLREDVAAALPQYANALRSGFFLSATVGERVQQVGSLRVQAISSDGSLQEVVVTPLQVAALTPVEAEASPPPQQVASTTPAIHMHCDDVVLQVDGALVITGWAVCRAAIAAIEVYFDGELIGEAELGGSRSDVAQQFPAIAVARYSGFRFDKQMGDNVTGEHQVVLVARNGVDDIRSETRNVSASEPKHPAHSGSAPADSKPAFRLEVDQPTVRNGIAAEIIGSRLLTISGWALAETPVVAIAVFVDDELMGAAKYGLNRRDVAKAFPDRADALHAGYIYYCPSSSFRDGAHAVRVEAQAADGEVATSRFSIEVRKAEGGVNNYARIRRHIPSLQADQYADMLNRLDYHPRFWMILRETGALDAGALEATLHSLATQVYDGWRLVLGPKTGEVARSLCAQSPKRLRCVADRIEVTDDLAPFNLTTPNGWTDKERRRPGRVKYTNPDLIELLRGETARDAEGAPGADWCGFLSPGDELGCDAMAEIAAFGGMHREADLVYADELRIDPVTGKCEPFFKPDYAPDLLLSTNYIGRPWFATWHLLRKVGATSGITRRDSEYDLVLRCAERANDIRHLPKLLCQRAAAASDTPLQEQEALLRAVRRRGIEAEVLPGCLSGMWRLRRTSGAQGLVSILIPTCAANGYIKTCIETLRSQTAFRRFEIVVVENIPETEGTWKEWLTTNADKIITINEPFNWSRFNNEAARHAAGDYLLFLNDDIEIIQEDWLDAMLEHAQRPEVGIVGARLLYPDRKVQHAGMFLASVGLARHAFRMSAEDDPGYFGFSLTQRNVIAVTGACLLVRRHVFEALGGFDEAHAVVNNDLDFCLKAHEAGLLTVYTPYATLLHHELASRNKLDDIFNAAHFNDRWKHLFMEGDPYFNPQLSRHSDDFSPDEEPVSEIFAGHQYRREQISRILVVKLDHIGDFITAIPAMRRLKALFPAATLYVLASRSVQHLAALEPCIDEYIDFEFFHARSELGTLALDESDFDALRKRLAAYRFDLAIDLRSHTETRRVLRYTGARILAGYECAGAHPFLDIALEQQVDLQLIRKRTHISDALINLVNAVGTAFDTQSTELTLLSPESTNDLSFLSVEVRRLFAKPVVAVQPGVGNAARQWPPEHFAALIELLIQRNQVSVILIGGPDDQELADEILAMVEPRDGVVSLIGKTSMVDLPRLLAACALYVGNNTGPKHIAAGLGVPTIGIHSGVVDAVEWGPRGKQSIALQRRMHCSPCYLQTPADCPRDMACMRQLEPRVVHRYCERFLAQPIRSSAPPRSEVIEKVSSR